MWYGEEQAEYPLVPFFVELTDFGWATLRKNWAVDYTRAIENQLDVAQQDERIVVTHRPRQGGLDSGDKYIPANRPILLYYQHRDKLLHQANEAIKRIEKPASLVNAT